MRLFVAVTPPAAIKNAVVERYMEIPRARWEKKENLHLTLRFIGDVDESTAAGIKAGLAKIRHSAFSLRVRGAGSFGRPARVLWLGLEPQDEICALAARAEQLALSVGLEPEKRAFSPHLTVARLKESPPILVRSFIERNQSFETEAFEIGALELYESVSAKQSAERDPRISSGVEYRVVESYPLAARS